jgi:predicted nucleotidyltransferase component of viral defense system
MPTNNQIVLILKEKIDSIMARGTTDAETLRNILKEELQFYVLNFIFHHPEYSNWIMYGGSALRICHGLDRMSVDLDFEVAHKINESFLNELKKEITEYFKDTYGLDAELLTTKITTDRGLRLCFNIGDLVGLNIHSKQVIVKIDLNHFTAAKTTIERIPINRNQLSFVIKTYNMSSLMASKIAAILLRGQRGGVDGVLYEEKGRDIYDLLWYMNEKIVPDIDYLKAKNIDITNLRELFDKLTLKMNKVDNTNLKNDLSPLFVDQTFIANWLKSWLESYLRLRGEYRINTITTLKNITVFEDMGPDIFSFTYRYNTEDGKMVMISYQISDYWMDVDLPTRIAQSTNDLIEFTSNGVSSRPTPKDKLKQFVSLFNEKNEGYFKKTGNIILGYAITTKLIRMTADKLNQAEQIVLDTSTLLSCELEDLLK